MPKKLFLIVVLLSSLIAGCGSSTPTVPVGTVLTVPTAGATLWYAPGGPDAPRGMGLDMVAKVSPGDKLTVCKNADGWSETFLIPDRSPWERVCSSNEVGWVHLSDLQSPGP